jgi:hypothetical protein
VVDLLTEIRQARENVGDTVVSAAHKINQLFLNSIILFNYCTNMKITLPDGHLGATGRAYPQSYPQILWVSLFTFSSNSLSALGEVISKIHRQAFEPA